MNGRTQHTAAQTHSYNAEQQRNTLNKTSQHHTLIAAMSVLGSGAPSGRRTGWVRGSCSCCARCCCGVSCAPAAMPSTCTHTVAARNLIVYAQSCQPGRLFAPLLVWLVGLARQTVVVLAQGAACCCFWCSLPGCTHQPVRIAAV